MLLDVGSYHKLYSTCYAVENLNKKKSLGPTVEAGAKYVERRCYGDGGKEEFVVYVTVIDEGDRNNQPKVFVKLTSFHSCTATSRHTLETLPDGRCKLAMSYAMVPDGLCGKLYFWFRRRQWEQDGSAALLMDLKDIRHAAETK